MLGGMGSGIVAVQLEGAMISRDQPGREFASPDIENTCRTKR
jgi:hypothetical protein